MIVLVCILVALVIMVEAPTGRRRRGNGPGQARFAGHRDLRRLSTKSNGDRLVLGRLAGSWRRGPELSVESRHSIVVLGPTQSGKTTGLAIPALLRWSGGVVAASVKNDLVGPTVRARRAVGPVYVFDPSRSSGQAASSFDPLRDCTTWPEARRLALQLARGATTSIQSAESEFWFAAAAKLLAPLLLAAGLDGRTIESIGTWLDGQELTEIADLLESFGCHDALNALRATWAREERQRSSVFTTAETIIDPFCAGGCGEGPPFDPSAVVEGRATLYLCAPAHDQMRLRSVFSLIVSTLMERAYERALLNGCPLDPPLLVVLDEAAQLTPLDNLDVLAATSASHGIQLVTVFQDLAQLQARYGTGAATVVNNHRAKVFLGGISDPATLDLVARLSGERTVHHPTAYGRGRGAGLSTTPIRQPLCPPEAVRQLPGRQAIVVYHSLPPFKVTLTPYYEDRSLQSGP